jgi:hypothetical protein
VLEDEDTERDELMFDNLWELATKIIGEDAFRNPKVI